MKSLLIGIVLAIAACSTVPPEGSVARVKYDARRALIAQCIESPESFGFPYTRAENADLLGVAPGMSLNVYSHCRRVAAHKVP